jgi:hypothetical protein
MPAAAELLARARRGEVRLHLPNVCLAEARRAILARCQPRGEANAIRRYLASASPTHVTVNDAASTRTVLDKYESSIKHDLDALPERLRTLAGEACIDVFGLADAMLRYATELMFVGLDRKPFDHTILAGIIVRANQIWDAGDEPLSFCETDADLQPWDKHGNPKPPLRDLYDQAHVWVYGDFTLTEPPRRQGFP